MTSPAWMSLALLSVAGLQRPGRPAPDDLARALQARYDTVRDFSAEFVQTYQGGVLPTQTTERGTLLVKKPGKMRWTYTSPERKVFVSDGRKIYAYLPQDKQVIVRSVPSQDEATTPALFLAGKGHLTRDFAVSYTEVAEAPASSYALKLVPKKPEREYEWLILVVDRESLTIRTLVTVDQQGGRSTFVFGKLKENVGLADKDFVFKAPRGVDVIVDDSWSR